MSRPARCWFFLPFVACVLAVAVPAQAAFLNLSREAREDSDFQSRLAAKLAPAPLHKGEVQSYFRGIVLQFRPQHPGAQPGSDDAFAQVLFQGFGPGGRDRMPKPVWISSRLLFLWSELDSVLALRRALNNLDEVLGVPFGSPEWERAELEWLDETGELGLAEPRITPFPTGVLPGSWGGTMRDGQLTVGRRSEISTVDNLDPRLISSPDRCFNLVVALARSRRYGLQEPGFDRAATRLAGFMAQFAGLDPNKFSGPLQEKADRIRQEGWMFMDKAHRAFSVADNDSWYTDPELPVTWEEVVVALLRVMRDEPVFRRNLNNPDLDLAVGLTKVAGGLGAGDKRGMPSPSLLAEMKQTLVSLLQPRVTGDEAVDEQDAVDLEARWIRVLDSGSPEGLPVVAFIHDAANAAGWGNARATLPFAERVFDILLNGRADEDPQQMALLTKTLSHLFALRGSPRAEGRRIAARLDRRAAEAPEEWKDGSNAGWNRVQAAMGAASPAAVVP